MTSCVPRPRNVGAPHSGGTIRRPSGRSVLATAVVLSLASCGASGGQSEGAKPKTDFTTTTSRSASTTEAKTSTTSGPSAAELSKRVRQAAEQTLAADAFTVDSDAKLAVGTERVHLAVKGSVDYQNVVGDAEILVESSPGAQNLGIKSDGTKLWVRTDGPQAPVVPDGKTWIEGDATRLAQASNFSPTGLIGVLLALGGSKEAEQVSTGKADGVATKTYSTTATYGEAVDAAGSQAEAFKASLSLKADKDPNLKMDVEIGADGLIRHFVLDVETTGTVSLEGHYTVDLTDVNGDISPPDSPPANEILRGPQADTLLDKLVA